MRVRVAYVGPSVSGRRTSLLSVLRECGGPCPIVPEGDGTTYEAEVRDRLGVPHDVVFTVDSSRTHSGVLPVTDALSDSGIRAEVRACCEADALVFVVESQAPVLLRNKAAWSSLEMQMAALGSCLRDKSVVFQLNKRDTPRTCDAAWSRENFAIPFCSHVESVATKGVGTLEAVQEAMHLVAMRTKP